MKPSLRLLAFALGTGLAFSAPLAAQAQAGVNIQIGAPAWGPPVPQGTQYYYIPEIDGYYDIYNNVYVVFDGVQWVQLPYIDGYDPYYFHPVPVSYVGPQPWLYIGTYRRTYPQYVTVYRHGGYGNAGRYGGRDYGAGRVYGYDHPGNGGRPNYNPGNGGRPGGFPAQPNHGSSPQPGNPGGGQSGPGRGGFGGQPGGNPGGSGQPGHGFGNGGNPGGGQPGGQGGFGGQRGGGGRRGGR